MAISLDIMKLEVFQNLDSVSKMVFCDPLPRGFDGLTVFGNAGIITD